jgi:hypothetical protein
MNRLREISIGMKCKFQIKSRVPHLKSNCDRCVFNFVQIGLLAVVLLLFLAGEKVLSLRNGELL